MEKKIKCSTCNIGMDEGFISTNESAIYWSKGKFGVLKSLFSKAHPIQCYCCPKCGKAEFYAKR